MIKTIVIWWLGIALGLAVLLVGFTELVQWMSGTNERDIDRPARWLRRLDYVVAFCRDIWVIGAAAMVALALGVVWHLEPKGLVHLMAVRGMAKATATGLGLHLVAGLLRHAVGHVHAARVDLVTKG